MVNPWTSQQSGTVKSVHEQEYLASQMHKFPELNEIWQQIIQITLTSPEPQTLLSRIAWELGKVFRSDICLVIAGGSSDATVQTGLWCRSNFSALDRDHTAQFLSHPLIVDGLEKSEPVAISNLQTNKTVSADGWQRDVLPVGALLKISTSFQKNTNGMIVIGHFQPHNWSDGEKELLKLVSEPIAIAFSGVQLQQQTQISERYQTLLKDFSRVIRNTTNLDLILKTALAKTAGALQVDRGLLLLLKYADPLYKSRRLQGFPKAKATVVEAWSAPTDTHTPVAETDSLKDYSFWLSEYPFFQGGIKKFPSTDSDR